jgi:hypothetical protein
MRKRISIIWSEGAPPETVDERQQLVAALVADLQNGIPADIGERTDEEKGALAAGRPS